MARSIFIALLALLATPALASPLKHGSTPVWIIYGDSRWDRGGAGSTGIYDLQNYVPDWFVVRNFAQSGAEVWQQGCTGVDTTGLDSGSGTCPNGRDRAVQHSGTCRYQPSDWRAPTCIADQIADPASHTEGIYIEFGANGIRKDSDANTSNWTNVNLPTWESDFDLIVADIPDTTPCVLAITYPIWADETAVDTGALSYQEMNRRIHEDLRPLVQEGAALKDCAVADLYSAIVDYEASSGTSAMLSVYFNCSAKGVTAGAANPGGGTEDCVHTDNGGFTPADAHPLGLEIERAVNEAMRRKPNRWQ